MRQATADFDFNTYVRALTEFCNEDLSAFFFDIRKDSLYCDAATDPKRRAYRTVLDTLFHALVRYGAPVLVFTSEEVWASRYPDGDSVHLLEWPQVPTVAVDEARWSELRALRQTVNEAIEPLRREKVLGSSLEAEVVGVSYNSDTAAILASVDFAELTIVSRFKVVDGQPDAMSLETVAETRGLHPVKFEIGRSTDHKCGRCWRLLPEVSEDGDLCARCDDVVAQIDAGAVA